MGKAPEEEEKEEEKEDEKEATVFKANTLKEVDAERDCVEEEEEEEEEEEDSKQIQ